MNIVKHYITIPLWLIYIDVLEVVILLVIYLIKYVPNKTEDLLNDYMINMITAINESKTLTRHIPCECKCKFYGMKCNSNQIWNNGKYQCECKNPKKHVCKKNYIWNPSTYACENGKYAGSIIVDSVITCDEIIETIKAISTNKYSKKF